MSERWTDKKTGYIGGIPANATALSLKRFMKESLGNIFSTKMTSTEDGNSTIIKGHGKYEKIIHEVKSKITEAASSTLLVLSSTTIKEILCQSTGYSVKKTYTLDVSGNRKALSVNWSNTHGLPVVSWLRWTDGYTSIWSSISTIEENGTVSRETDLPFGGLWEQSIVTFCDKDKNSDIYYVYASNSYFWRNASTYLFPDTLIAKIDSDFTFISWEPSPANPGLKAALRMAEDSFFIPQQSLFGPGTVDGYALVYDWIKVNGMAAYAIELAFTGEPPTFFASIRTSTGSGYTTLFSKEWVPPEYFHLAEAGNFCYLRYNRLYALAGYESTGDKIYILDRNGVLKYKISCPVSCIAGIEK